MQMMLTWKDAVGKSASVERLMVILKKLGQKRLVQELRKYIFEAGTIEFFLHFLLPRSIHTMSYICSLQAYLHRTKVESERENFL